jgi:hypothetical protein
MEYPEQPTTPTISQHHLVLDPSHQATNVPNIPAQYPISSYLAKPNNQDP